MSHRRSSRSAGRNPLPAGVTAYVRHVKRFHA